MSLNAGEMLVLQALETGLDSVQKEYANLRNMYSAYIKEPDRIRYARKDVKEILAAIEIVKGWGERNENA